jgi:alkyldihydroxyacetonephosphate synthase
VHVGSQFGSEFMKTRFTTPYLRNTLWDVGYGVDTMETATSWDCVETMMTAMESAARDAAAAFGEKIHAYTHLSHVYPTGCSVYMTCAFRLCADPDEQLERWRALKRAVSTAIVSLGGTISHQHGVGRDHRPYLSAEIGATFGTATLQHTIDHFDPDGILNSGNLVGGHDVAST